MDSLGVCVLTGIPRSSTARTRRRADARVADGAELRPVDAMRLARAVTQEGPLGKGRIKLVRWILDAMDVTKQVHTPYKGLGLDFRV